MTAQPRDRKAFLVTLPRGLHKELKMAAVLRETSMANIVRTAVAKEIKADRRAR